MLFGWLSNSLSAATERKPTNISPIPCDEMVDDKGCPKLEEFSKKEQPFGQVSTLSVVARPVILGSDVLWEHNLMSGQIYSPRLKSKCSGAPLNIKYN